MIAKPSLFALFLCLICAGAGATELTLAELEARGAVIGAIELRRDNVFEEPGKVSIEALGPDARGDQQNQNSPPPRRLHQFANRLHYVTRENVIRSQLLFASGEALRKTVVEETTRLLRSTGYLFDAEVIPTRYEDGVVDLLVVTRDIWTLTPELDYSSTGGDTFYTLGVEEDNLLGTGASLTLSRSEELERTSNLLLYSNRNFLLRRLNLGVGIVNSDDGGAFSFDFSKPFFSLDTRRARGVSTNYFDGSRPYFRNGDDIGEFDQRSTTFNLFTGWSSGRDAGWVKRWSAGIAGERSEFSLPDDPTLAITRPADRELYYPYISFTRFEDKFTTTRNFQSIERVEDLYLGTRYSASVGLAHRSLGSDRTAFLVSASTSHATGSPEDVLWQSSIGFNTRLESGRPQNFIANARLSWSLRQSERFRLFSTLSATHSERPDLDRFTALGGTTGLRGYPTRFRNGGGRALLTVEQRYYSDYYPFQLFRVGAAAFIDAGQVWGENILGETNDDLLANAGFGLRLASTRGGSNKVIQIDLAFPLTSRENIDSVQLVLQANRAF